MKSSTQEIHFAIADRIGKLYEDIRDTLHNALQMISNKEQYPISALPFIDAAFEEVEKKSRDKDFYQIIDEQERKRAILMFASTLGVALVLFIGVSPLRDSLNRLIQYQQSFIPPAPYSLEISPVNKTVLRGSKEEIIISVKGSLPPKIILHVKEEMQDTYDTISITTDTSHIYRYQIPSAKASLTFYAHADWLAEQVLSPKGSIQVIDRPEIRSLTGTISPPAYSKQSGRTLDEQSADILALHGTSVSLEVIANKELSRAYILFLIPKGSVEDKD